MKKKFLNVFLPIIMCCILPTSVSAKTEDTWISKTAQKACVDYGKEYGICPELLMAMIERESNGNPNTKNGTCTGLMQVSSRWHAGRMKELGVTSLYNERGNVHVGANYLSELIEDSGEVALALMIYHGESDAEEKYENGKISSYASGILKRSEKLERIHGK